MFIIIYGFRCIRQQKLILTMAMSTLNLSSDHVLKGLDELRDQELLCDIHLVAEGAKFPAHRVVLAAASPYFQAMFTGGFKENQMNEITLNETSSKGLESVLDAIYTAQLSLSEENICDVLQVANHLQLMEVVKHCEEFLVPNLSSHNCLSFLSTAEKYDVQETVDACNKFILENFDVISQSKEFTDISKEQLLTYLSDDRLTVRKGEIQVFKAALKWLEAKRSAKGVGNNSSDLADLMTAVRFPLIPSDTLLDDVLTCPLMSENTQVMRMVTEALKFHNKLFSQPLQEGKQFQPRGKQMLALIRSTGGFVIGKTMLHMLNESGGKPFHAQFSETTLRTNLRPWSLSVVTKGNYLFLFGAGAEYFRPIAVRFDVKTNTWLDLKPPPYKACEGMAAAVLKENIYLLGGGQLIKDNDNTVKPHDLTACVSQYSIGTNSWSKLQNLPRPLMCHAAASQGNFVFCAGGESTATKFSKKLYAFDVSGKIWLTKASMKRKRYSFSLEAVGAKLVACGDKTSPSVEIYDIADDQWTLLQNEALVNQFYPATIVLSDKVYVIGGYGKGEDGTTSRTDYVSCVDVDNGTVRRVSNLPFNVGRTVCALLTVPNTFTVLSAVGN